MFAGFALFFLAMSGQQAHEVRVLFANDAWYLENPDPERAFIGEVRGTPLLRYRDLRPRHFYLVTADGSWDIFTAGHDKVIKEFEGARVRIVGKTLQRELEGIERRELWPGTLQILNDR